MKGGLIMKKRFSGIIFLICSVLLVIVLVSQCGDPPTRAADGKFICIPDHRGGFYLSASDDDPMQMQHINSKGISSVIKLNSIDYSFACAGKDRICFITLKRASAYISDEKNQFSPDKYILLDRVQISENRIVFDLSDNIYVVDDNAPSVVRKYTRYGVFIQEISLSEKIDRLFCDYTDGSVYALCGSSAWSIDERRMLPGKGVPSVCDPVEGRCSDDCGNVYTFSASQGYKKVFASPYGNACVSKNGIWSYDGNTVYQIGEDGLTAASMDLTVPVDDLVSSSDTVAAVSGEKLIILDRSGFVPVDNEEEPPEQKNPSSGDNSSAPSGSCSSCFDLPETRSELSNTSSANEQDKNNTPPQRSGSEDHGAVKEKLYISGRFLYLDKSMTLAALKKELLYGNTVDHAVSHRSRTVTGGNVGTGWTFQYPGYDSITVIVYGDLTGEGNVNSNDVNKLSTYILSGSGLSDNERLAADTDKNGTIDLHDLYSIYKWDT